MFGWNLMSWLFRQSVLLVVIITLHLYWPFVNWLHSMNWWCGLFQKGLFSMFDEALVTFVALFTFEAMFTFVGHSGIKASSYKLFEHVWRGDPTSPSPQVGKSDETLKKPLEKLEVKMECLSRQSKHMHGTSLMWLGSPCGKHLLGFPSWRKASPDQCWWHTWKHWCANIQMDQVHKKYMASTIPGTARQQTAQH